MSSNDNDAVGQSAPPLAGAHGQAALLLVESLIHGLRENDTLSREEAVAIAERAIDVQRDHAEVADGASAPMWRSHALLSQIATSLRADEKPGPPPHLAE